MKGFADIADKPEDERIEIIAHFAQHHIAGFVVEDDAKADRYCAKLAAYPVRIVDRGPGPIKGTVLVKVGPKES